MCFLPQKIIHNNNAINPAEPKPPLPPTPMEPTRHLPNTLLAVLILCTLVDDCSVRVDATAPPLQCLATEQWGDGAWQVCADLVYSAHNSSDFTGAKERHRSLTNVLGATGAVTDDCDVAIRHISCTGHIPACSSSGEVLHACSTVCTRFKTLCSASIALALKGREEKRMDFAAGLLDCTKWSYDSTCSAFTDFFPCFSEADIVGKSVGNVIERGASLCALPEAHPLRNSASIVETAERRDGAGTFDGIEFKLYSTFLWIGAAVVVVGVAFFFTTATGSGLKRKVVVQEGGPVHNPYSEEGLDSTGKTFNNSSKSKRQSILLADDDIESGMSPLVGERSAVEQSVDTGSKKFTVGERFFSIRFCSQIVSMLLTTISCAVVFFVSTNQLEKDLKLSNDATFALQEESFAVSVVTSNNLVHKLFAKNVDSARRITECTFDGIYTAHSTLLNSGISPESSGEAILSSGLRIFESQETDTNEANSLFYQIKRQDPTIDVRRIIARKRSRQLTTFRAKVPLLNVAISFNKTYSDLNPNPPDLTSAPTAPTRYRTALANSQGVFQFDVRPGDFTDNTFPNYWQSLGSIQSNFNEVYTKRHESHKDWADLGLNFGQLSATIESSLYKDPTTATWTITTGALVTKISEMILSEVVAYANERVVICENSTEGALLAASHASLTVGTERATYLQNDDAISTKLVTTLLADSGATNLAALGTTNTSKRVVTVLGGSEMHNMIFRGYYDTFTLTGFFTEGRAALRDTQFIVFCFIPVMEIEGDIMTTRIDLLRRYEEQLETVKENEDRSHRFLVFVSMLLVFLAMILSLVTSSTSTSALQTVIEDLQDIGTFRLTRLQQRHQTKPLSKLTEVRELQKSIQQTLKQLQEYRNQFPSLSMAVKAMGRRRASVAKDERTKSTPNRDDDSDEDTEDPLAQGVKAAHAKHNDLSAERTCKVTVIYLSRNLLKKADKKSKSRDEGTDVRSQQRAVKKTRTFEWHYQDPATASLPSLLRASRSALGEMVGEPLELTAVIPRSKRGPEGGLASPLSASPSSNSSKRGFPEYAGDDSDGEVDVSNDTRYPLRHSHHLQDFLQMYPDFITLHVKKNSKTNYLAPLTAMASVFGKVGLVLMVFRMYWSDSDVGTRLAPVQVVILVLGFTLNLVWSFKLSRKATEIDEQMTEWTSNFQTETTLVMVLTGFNMQNLLVLWSGVRIGGLLRFHAPFPRKLKTQVIRWSMFSLIVGDVLPLVVTLFFLQETGGWGSDFTAEITIAFQSVAILTGSVKKFVAFCLVDDRKLEKEEQEEEDRRLKKTQNSNLTPQVITVMKVRLSSAYHTGDYGSDPGKAGVLDPLDLGVNLRRFYTIVSAAVRMRGAMLLDATDGEVTAIFNHPFPVDKHEVMAVSAAVEVLRSKPRLHSRPNSSAPDSWISMSIVSGSFLKGNLRADGRSFFHFVGEQRPMCEILLHLCEQKGGNIVVNENVMRKVAESRNELITEYFGRAAGAVKTQDGVAERFFQIIPLYFARTNGGGGRLRANSVLWRSERILSDTFGFLDNLLLHLAAQGALPPSLATSLAPTQLTPPPPSFSPTPFPRNTPNDFIPLALGHLKHAIQLYCDEVVHLNEKDPYMTQVADLLVDVQNALREGASSGRGGVAVLSGIYPLLVCVCGRGACANYPYCNKMGAASPKVVPVLAPVVYPSYPDIQQVRSPLRPLVRGSDALPLGVNEEDDSAFSMLSPEENESFSQALGHSGVSRGSPRSLRLASSPSPKSTTLSARGSSQPAPPDPFAQSDNDTEIDNTSLSLSPQRLSQAGTPLSRHPLRLFPRRSGGIEPAVAASPKSRSSLVGSAQTSLAAPRTPTNGRRGEFEGDSGGSGGFGREGGFGGGSDDSSSVGPKRDAEKILETASALLGISAPSVGRGAPIEAASGPAPPRRRRKLGNSTGTQPKAMVTSGVNFG